MTSSCNSLPSPWFLTLSQRPCTARTTGICLPLGLGKETVSDLWKTVKTSTGQLSPQSPATEAIPKLHLDQTITKGRWQHVSYPTDSPTASKLRLCSSLIPERTAIMMGVWVGQDFCKSNGDQIEREIPCGVRQGSLLGRMAYWLDPGPSRYATGFVSGRK